jgi:hypothetical protein
MAASRRLKRPAKNAAGDEFATFNSALKQVLSVSSSEIKSRMASEKLKRNRGKKPASHAGDAKD